MFLTPATKFAVIVNLLIAALASAFAGDRPTILRESSSVGWLVPTFSASGNTQCDADGNLYFHVSPSDGLLKVAHDGSKYHFYELPSDADSKTYGFVQFNVTPSGDLRVLAYGSGGSAYILLFDPDFSDTSKTKLETPEHFHASSFAAFESGANLVAGYFDQSASRELRGKTYTAIFEASGKLRAVVAGHFGDVDLASVGKNLPEGGVALGEDGFLYLLRPEEVVVVSESGTIARRIPFRKPNAGLVADRVDVAGGLLAVELMEAQGLGKELKAQYLVLNASTGDRVGLYQPEPALGNNLLCFSRSMGFAFQTVRDGKVTLLTAPFR